MNEYIFTELISMQFRNFMVMFVLGCGIFCLYRIMRKYIILRIGSTILKSFLELIFFITGSLLTGGVIDCCCNASFEPYMVPAMILGLPVSILVIGK